MKLSPGRQRALKGNKFSSIIGTNENKWKLSGRLFEALPPQAIEIIRSMSEIIRQALLLHNNIIKLNYTIKKRLQQTGYHWSLC